MVQGVTINDSLY